MRSNKFRSDCQSALVWAIFSLGASQLAFVLGGTFSLFVTLFCCGTFLAIYLIKAQIPINRTQKRMAIPFLLSTGMLLVGNVLYIYLFFLGTDFYFYVLFSCALFIFMLPLPIALAFAQKVDHVPK